MKSYFFLFVKNKNWVNRDDTNTVCKDSGDLYLQDFTTIVKL